MDVVEVSPNTTPPVCKIMDYGKYIFEQKKKNQGSKKKQKVIHVKEIKFRPLIEDGDYKVKLGKIINFLEQGDKVKVSLRFRGREMRHTELGENLLNRVCGDIENVGLIEQEAEFEGRQLIMVVAPRHQLKVFKKGRRNMPKLKTNRGAAKRFKKTATGKYKRSSSHMNHILTKKSSKRKRQLRSSSLISDGDLKSVKKLLPYS